ncbi:MAG: hypothetical protein IKC79_02270 [Clostridia bacterium]|nr:hypothetical protein [Clostridia bacterium]
MTRKEYTAQFKVYGLMLLCVLPILIVLNVLLNNVVEYWVMVLIDCILIVVGAIVAMKIDDKRKARIAQKRAEFEAKQKKSDKGE